MRRDEGGTLGSTDPSWELKRLATLASYDVLDSPPEASIDRIAQIAAAVCETPIALVTLIDKERQWFKARVGWELEETELSRSFCAIAIRQGDALVVEDALVDERFAKNPLVTETPNIRFYAGVPLRARNGMPLGTLCVIDRRARTLTPAQTAALTALAAEVEGQLELRQLLVEASKTSTARQELAALVVHDLRSPVSSMLLLGRWLRAHPQLPDALMPAVEEIVGSGECLLRMAQDLVDVTRSESGGIATIVTCEDLGTLLEHVASAARRRAAITDHRVATAFDVGSVSIETDVSLLRRMLDNFLDNAMKYAPRTTTITLGAALNEARTHVRLSVTDAGLTIPAEHRDDVFEARVRIHATHARESLGLGLRFCRLAAAALGGRAWVDEASGGGNQFSAELPLRAPSSSS